MKRETISKAAGLLTLLMLGAGIWWMSQNAVWLGDDLDYKYRMKGALWQSWGFINNIGQYFESQAVHYIHVNGRSVAHALVQLYCGVLGQTAFALSNAAVYMLFAWMLAYSGGVKISNASGIATAAGLSVVCFVTKMMPTCQIGYIWGMAANLIWLSSFFKSGKISWAKVAGMTLSGIAVGNWQEAISIGVGAGLGIWWLSQFFNRQKSRHKFFDWKRSWMMAAYLAGALINIASPANFGRAAAVSTSWEHEVLICLYSLIGLWLLIIVMAAYRQRLGFSFQIVEGIPTGVLWTGVLFLLAFNLFIGIFANRQLFGIDMLAIVLLLRLLPRHSFGWTGNILLLIAVGSVWAIMYAGISEVKRQYADIAEFHAASPDGSVEYDRQRVLTLGHPLDAKYYEDILGQFDNDLHHSMMKDFKHERKGKTLKLKPTMKPNGEKWEMYAPGHFYVSLLMPKKGEPKRKVVVFGHYQIGGVIRMKARPVEIEIEKYSRMRPPYGTAIIIPEIPMYCADSIAIISTAK